MLKTISAAVLAISVFAAPALAASQAKITKAPVSKTHQVKHIKPSALNAKAKMSRHHVRQSKKHIGSQKTQKISKVSIKKAPSVNKRG